MHYIHQADCQKDNSLHKDPNDSTIIQYVINQHQLFDLKKSSVCDSGDTKPGDSSSITTLPFNHQKKININSIPHQHHYGNRSET